MSQFGIGDIFACVHLFRTLDTRAWAHLAAVTSPLCPSVALSLIHPPSPPLIFWHLYKTSYFVRARRSGDDDDDDDGTLVDDLKDLGGVMSWGLSKALDQSKVIADQAKVLGSQAMEATTDAIEATTDVLAPTASGERDEFEQEEGAPEPADFSTPAPRGNKLARRIRELDSSIGLSPRVKRELGGARGHEASLALLMLEEVEAVAERQRDAVTGSQSVEQDAINEIVVKLRDENQSLQDANEAKDQSIADLERKYKKLRISAKAKLKAAADKTSPSESPTDVPAGLSESAVALSAQVAALQGECDRLKGELAQVREARPAPVADSSELLAELEKCKAQLLAQQAEADQAQDELVGVTGQLTSLEESSRDLEVRYQESQRAQADAQAEIDRLVSDAGERAQAQVSAQQAEAASASNAQATLRASNADLQARCAELEGAGAESRAELDRCKSELERMVADTNLRAAEDTLASQNGEAELQRVRLQIVEETSARAQAEAEVAAVEGELQRVQAQIAEETSARAQGEAELATTKGQLSSLKASGQAEVDAVVASRTVLEEANAELEARCLGREQAEADARAELGRCQGDLERALADAQQRTTNDAQAEQEDLAAARTQLAELAATKNELEARLVSLTAVLDGATADRAALEKSLAEAIEERDTGLAESNEDAAKSAAELAAAQQRLADLEVKHAETAKQASNLLADMDDAEFKLGEARENLEQTKVDAQQRLTEVEAAAKRDLEAQLEGTRAQLANEYEAKLAEASAQSPQAASASPEEASAADASGNEAGSAQTDALAAQLKTTKADLMKSKKARIRAKAAIAALEEKVRGMEQQLEEAHQAVSAASSTPDAAAPASVATKEAEVADVAAAAAEEERSQLEAGHAARLQALRTDMEQQATELESSLAACSELQGQLDAARADAVGVSAKAAASDGELKVATERYNEECAKAQEARNASENLNAQLDEYTASVQRLTEALKGATEETEILQAQLEESALGAQHLAQELDAAKAKSAALESEMTAVKDELKTVTERYDEELAKVQAAGQTSADDAQAESSRLATEKAVQDAATEYGQKLQALQADMTQQLQKKDVQMEVNSDAVAELNIQLEEAAAEAELREERLQEALTAAAAAASKAQSESAQSAKAQDAEQSALIEELNADITSLKAAEEDAKAELARITKESAEVEKRLRDEADALVATATATADANLDGQLEALSSRLDAACSLKLAEAAQEHSSALGVLLSKLTWAEERLADSSAERQRLVTQLEKTRDLHRDAVEGMRDQFNQQLVEQEDALGDFTNRLKEAASTIQSMEASSTAVQDENQHLNSELDSTTAALNDVEKRYVALEAQLDDQMSTNIKVTDRESHLEEVLHQAKAESAKIAGELEAARAAQSSSAEKHLAEIAARSTEFSTYARQVDVYKVRAEQAESDLTGEQESHAGLKLSYEQLQDTITKTVSELERTSEESEQRAEVADAETEDLSQQLHEQAVIRGGLQARVAELEMKLTNGGGGGALDRPLSPGLNTSGNEDPSLADLYLKELVQLREQLAKIAPELEAVKAEAQSNAEEFGAAKATAAQFERENADMLSNLNGVTKLAGAKEAEIDAIRQKYDAELRSAEDRLGQAQIEVEVLQSKLTNDTAIDMTAALPVSQPKTEGVIGAAVNLSRLMSCQRLSTGTQAYLGVIHLLTLYLMFTCGAGNPGNPAQADPAFQNDAIPQ